MKPCYGTPGVIFNHEEVSTIAEALDKYLTTPNIIRSSRAKQIYEAIEPLLHPKYGECAGIFVPADVVIEVGKEMQGSNAPNEQPLHPIVGSLGYLGVFGAAVPMRPQMPQSSQETSQAFFAHKMIKQAEKSREVIGRKKR